jgi:nitroreductase
MEEKIKKVLEAAILAPSGENCQPWQIRLTGNKLELYNDPNKDTSIYNHNQMGSMVAHGAFLENLSIASKVMGLTLKIQIFPDQNDPDLVAIVEFTENNAHEDSLYQAILKRTTNRKFYKKVSLTPEQKKVLIDSGDEVGNGQVKLIENAELIKKISEPISLNEQLIFENPLLHNFFYNHVRWTKEEDDKFKDGFYIKTLELNPIQKLSLKLLKSWKWALRARKIRMSKQIAKDNAKNYGSASAIGVVIIPGNISNDYITAGRIMERVWLKVTSMRLSLQPMTGVLFFMQKILAKQDSDFSANEIILIKDAYKEIARSFDVSEDQTIAMLFRIGDGGEPSARSSRFDISQITKTN